MILPIINVLVTGQKNTNINFIDNYLAAFTLKETFFIYLIVFFIFFLFKNTIVLITQFLQLKIVYEIKKSLSNILFQEFLFTSFGEIELNYTSNNPQFSQFTVGFKCNYLDIKMEI